MQPKLLKGFTDKIGNTTGLSRSKLTMPLVNKTIIFKCTSILFYHITLKDRRGTTDEFATIPFHFVLFSAALVELA